MSRIPPQAPASVHQSYNYPPTHTAVPMRNYYYDESEGSYIGDFSESEGLSEGPHGVQHAADVTELYRRKAMPMVAPAPPPTDRYVHRGVYYTHPDYYYETIPTMIHPSQVRRTPVVPAAAYRRRVSVQDERVGHYYPTEVEDAYGRVAYKSTPHISAAQQTGSPSRAPSATVTQTARRRPAVTVRTPRYYRRAGTVSKKPSALCLPTSCQPDPAIYRRTRRTPADTQYQQQEVSKPTATEQTDINKMDSRGDVNATTTDLDHMLARYEKIFSEIPNTSRKSEATATALKNVGMLKPRVPASIKAKQEKLLKMRSAMKASNEKHSAPPSPTIRTSRRVEVEEITTEVLDNLLNELMKQSNKKEPEENTTEAKEQRTSNTGRVATEKETDIKEKASDVLSQQECQQQPISKSFNYQDIKQHLLKVQQQNEEAKEKENVSMMNRSPSSRPSPRPSTYHGISKSALDPQSVMELHKSKSYIISLIDRALSKELGTIPEPKYANREFDYQHMDAKMAIDAMNKHIGGKADKDLCIEMTQALTESFVSNAAAASQSADKTEMSCPSLSGGEEPLYLKQLRQLRWGHFKHIQKEMRRLEDLERFLDTCTYTNGF